ncbi:hypothetical protein NDU88_002912 [Pleurodeles waltl]|uniref:Uncharacterized protein n=1 Tax=Pleurodeles waltl TaxID=8319 RepID=A0AAV7UZ65_PLEWA|nr:hypothetical protein NDU88_002912 [Pleurodeles waltl]
MYSSGTVENATPDPKGLQAAAANLPGANSEVERVLKPVRTEQEKREFSSGGEDGVVEERWTNRLKQTPEEGRCQGETPSNRIVRPEEGNWEARQSEQTGHALGRAGPGQVQSEIQAGYGENGGLD